MNNEMLKKVIHKNININSRMLRELSPNRDGHFIEEASKFIALMTIKDKRNGRSFLRSQMFDCNSPQFYNFITVFRYYYKVLSVHEEREKENDFYFLFKLNLKKITYARIKKIFRYLVDPIDDIINYKCDPDLEGCYGCANCSSEIEDEFPINDSMSSLEISKVLFNVKMECK